MDSALAEFLALLLDRHGHDFHGYRRSSLTTRLGRLCQGLGLAGLPQLTEWLQRHPERIDLLVDQLVVPVSELFREPETFAELRAHVFPMLSSYASITIWHAGCAAGQEVFSLAILLQEAGLYDRSRIFASDISDLQLDRARQGGAFTPAQIRAAAPAYLAAGGTGQWDDYFSEGAGLRRIDPAILRNITFIRHNLATDRVFCEANLILCRNVLIYFDAGLQDHVFGLFSDSLTRPGYLCLGSREMATGSGARFARHPGCARIFRPVMQARPQICLTPPQPRPGEHRGWRMSE